MLVELLSVGVSAIIFMAAIFYVDNKYPRK